MFPIICSPYIRSIIGQRSKGIGLSVVARVQICISRSSAMIATKKGHVFYDQSCSSGSPNFQIPL